MRQNAQDAKETSIFSMEGSGAGIGRLDCYEDMFKEITRKLYGDDPDHRTSSVQNEFETSVSYKTEVDTDHGTDGSDDGNWTCEDEPFKGTDGSRIAAYHSGKTTWRCYECGDCMAGSPRDIAEHFMELHSTRILGDDLRNRHHSPRKDYLQNDCKMEEVIAYLERVRDRAERAAPPSRRTQETQTVPAALLPVTTTFLLQELPSSPATTQQQLHQNSLSILSSGSTASSAKRYTCPHCPYGTDRRDLYTRHENIHREEKPFHCYICYKPFNRADHVKKHFLRMHREHGYELARIRRAAGSSGGNNGSTTIPKTIQPETNSSAPANGNGNGQHTSYASSYNCNKSYQLPAAQQTSNGAGGGGGLYQTPSIAVSGISQPEANTVSGSRRIQNGGCNSKSHVKGGSKGAQERRYTCCYCSWSGVDNWCLKRHLNTHLKPFACALCEYKAARAERLATHVLKVHNKRQCSRCSFLGEDAAQLQVHQLHVHRVNNTTAPISTAPTSPPQNNRQQQPVQSSGGGRPPPGPPVFPASVPPIASSTSVISPTTILGRGTGKGTLRCKDDCNEDVGQATDHQLSVVRGRRSRKQSTPRKVTAGNSEETDDDIRKNHENVNSEEEKCGTTLRKPATQQRMSGTNPGYREANKTSREFLKCYLCPKEAPARGLDPKPYHTKASLMLHTLWRHRRARKPARNSSEAATSIRLPEVLPSAITLKATVITARSSDYGSQR